MKKSILDFLGVKSFSSQNTISSALTCHNNDISQCWAMIPTSLELERLKKYSENPHCPNCSKKLSIHYFHGNIGTTTKVRCGFGNQGCGWSEDITDYSAN